MWARGLCPGDMGLPEASMACYGKDSNRFLSAVAYLGLFGIGFEAGSPGEAGFEPPVFLISFHFPVFGTYCSVSL